VSSVLRPPRARSQQPEQLGDDDLVDLQVLLDADPLANVVLAARLEQVGSLEPAQLGGAVFGLRGASDQLVAAVFAGGNLLPLGGTTTDLQAIAGALARRRRTCNSIVGRTDAVRAVWHVLASAWGPARLIRERQPLLLLDQPPPARLDAGGQPARVRAMEPAHLDAYLPAAIAMFREELDLPPLAPAVVEEYRRRVAGLIRRGHAFGICDDAGRVLFKADIGSVSQHACQVQGVWTRPDQRGNGIATAALGDVLRRGLELAPTVSLYVNEFNDPARRLYRRLGMREVGTLTTLLF
jgi:predicted GNAT family acetyltransferase